MLAPSRPPFSFYRSVFVSSSLPSLSLLRPKRPQEPLLLRIDFSKNQTLGIRRRWSVVLGLKGKDEFEDLEAEVFEFMEASANPEFFPSKQELIAAGRGDLAEAIASRGGWLAYGWDSEEEGENERVEEEDRRVLENDWVPADEPLRDSGEECFALASSSGRSIEMENEEEAGIEGILSRLEKERNLAFGLGPREKKANGSVPRSSDEHDQGHAVASNDRGRLTESNNHQSSYFKFGDSHPQGGLPADTTKQKYSTPEEWTTWNLKRIGSLSGFEAAEIVPDNGKTLNHSFQSDGSINGIAADAPEESAAGTSEPQSDAHGSQQNHIRMRLRQLESELTSALHLLKSGNGGGFSSKEDSLEDMHRLSDAWEFQETEIMNARNKLRSIRAKIAVMEGKMALELIETQKIKEDKQRRLDAAKKSIQLLRTTCIIWANSASEVFLAGSFDGWTGQRKMEKSTAGMFYLYLKLYPGRYEMKFIVDGSWQVDPLRPLVNNNGHENNLLIVT